jgi:chemotaxis protein methyltransferase CheR
MNYINEPICHGLVKELDKTVFNILRKIVYDRAGIYLNENKEALVSSRVGKRLRALGIPDYKTYLQYLQKDRTGVELPQLLDAITTNVTSWFREPDHFEFLAESVQKWAGEDQNRFRIWSTASSSGEEPYSIGMVMLDKLKGFHHDTRILATDIDHSILERAKAGVYEAGKLGDIPQYYRNSYFKFHKNGKARCFKVNKPLRDLVTFAYINLSKPPFPMQGPFDVIFCRNVMIYLDNKVRTNLLRDISRLLRQGGYLMVGHSESLAGMLTDLKPVRPSIYIKE